MKSVTIQLNTINDVKQFVNIVSKCDYDVDLISGRYAVDAKSIMVSSAWTSPSRLSWKLTVKTPTPSSARSKPSLLTN